MAVATEVVLNTPKEIKVVSTGIWGALPKGLVGLILGCSSTSKQGILVLPGIIDSDYQGDLKIMIIILFGYHVLQPGQQVAQLLLFPYWVPNSNQVIQGEGNFGSTNEIVFWTKAITTKQPTLEITGKNVFRTSRYRSRCFHYFSKCLAT